MHTHKTERDHAKSIVDQIEKVASDLVLELHATGSTEAKRLTVLIFLGRALMQASERFRTGAVHDDEWGPARGDDALP